MNVLAGKQHCIVTVHGIRTYGDWQARLKGLLVQENATVDVRSYVYGYFSIIAFMFPPLRWLVTKRFRRELVRLAGEHPSARIDLVAHSFGTHLVGWALQGIPKSQRPHINTIILSGSVLRPDFPWNEMIAEGTVGRVINDCGIDDAVLVLNQATVLFTGMAGRVGFAGMTSGRFENRYFRGGHSLYFYVNGQASNEFMRRYWIPLLIGDEPLVEKDERSRPTVVEGIVNTLVRNVEPIKVGIYSLVLLTPALMFYFLYKDAEVQRTVAIEKAELARKASLNMVDTLQWLFNEMVPVRLAPDGFSLVNPAWDEETQKLIKELLTRLDRYDIAESVVIIGHVGQFCGMTEDGRSMYKASTRVVDADDCGRSSDYALVIGDKMAAAVQRRVRALSQTVKVPIRIASYGRERDRYDYPPPETSTVGEWNKIAYLNHRVDIEIKPSRSLSETESLNMQGNGTTEFLRKLWQFYYMKAP